MAAPSLQEIAHLAEQYTPDMVRFLRQMITTPSESEGT